MCKSKSFILLCCHHQGFFALIPTLFYLSKFIVSCQISDKVNRDQIHTVEILGEWTFFAEFSSPFLGPFNLARHSSIIYLFVGFETFEIELENCLFFPLQKRPQFCLPILRDHTKKVSIPQKKYKQLENSPNRQPNDICLNTSEHTHKTPNLHLAISVYIMVKFSLPPPQFRLA